MRRALYAILGAATAAVVVAGCSGSSARAPDFRPVPTGNDVEGNHGVHASPIVPVPSLGDGGGTGSGGSGGGGGGGLAPGKRKGDPLVVATHLTTPTGLSLLPDGTALVGERTTGRIVRVQPQPDKPVPTVRVLHGLDTVGGGGLLDLAVSPHYAEDNLIYAYVTTRTDNRVVDFTLHGPVTPVLTGIPKGRTGNAGRIAFGGDDDLYIGTGDAGRPALAADPKSLAGKLLRIDDIGNPAPGNPRRSSPVYSSGVRTVTGLCASPVGMIEVQDGPDGRPEVNLAGKGADFGYPGSAGPKAVGRPRKPVGTLPAAADGPGGCAVLDTGLWVASLDGKALFAARAGTGGGFGSFATFLHKRYGRLRTVVAAADGALWLTTSNRDGNGRPVPTDERVIRYVPRSVKSGSNT